jgi:ubiquinone/menaquinone biosynthesis C-methylase UbiE
MTQIPPSAELTRIREAYDRRLHSRAQESWFNPGNLFIIQDIERNLLSVLRDCGFSSLEEKKLLEIGCGTGYWLREFIKWGARPENMTGIDLLAERANAARRLCPAGVTIRCGNAGALEFPEKSFDLVLQSTVFTSILDPELQESIASEMLRVVKQDGLIIWYDFHVNNPRNPDVRGVKKQQIHRLFQGCRIQFRRITLAPPLARSLAPYSVLMCSLLQKLPWLCTHYLCAIRK